MCVKKQNCVNRKEVYSSYTDLDNKMTVYSKLFSIWFRNHKSKTIRVLGRAFLDILGHKNVIKHIWWGQTMNAFEH